MLRVVKTFNNIISEYINTNNIYNDYTIQGSLRDYTARGCIKIPKGCNVHIVGYYSDVQNTMLDVADLYSTYIQTMIPSYVGLITARNIPIVTCFYSNISVSKQEYIGSAQNRKRYPIINHRLPEVDIDIEAFLVYDYEDLNNYYFHFDNVIDEDISTLNDNYFIINVEKKLLNLKHIHSSPKIFKLNYIFYGGELYYA